MKKKKIILAVMLAFIILAISYLNSLKAGPIQSQEKDADKNEDALITQAKPDSYLIDEEEVLRKSLAYPRAPELAGISGHINTNSSLTIGSLKGNVIIVDFWTYTCINCIRTFPYLKDWHEKYEDDGLVIIGAHTPEFEFEKEYENVKSAVEKYGLKYAVVQDNNYETWRAYNNRYWPHKYLIDIDGFIRYDHIGEGGYEETEKVIKELLDERMQRYGKKKISEYEEKPSGIVDVDYGKIGTPEIYFGYGFTRGNFGNKEGLPAEKIVDYKVPASLEPNNVYLGGKWKVNKDNVELAGEEGAIFLGYDAKVVNIVAGSENGSEAMVFVDTNDLDDSKKGADVVLTSNGSAANIKEGRLYSIVDYEYGTGLLELRVSGEGFKLYTFTFG